MGAERFEEKGGQEIDHVINGLQYTSTKSDSFVVDIHEIVSHIVEKDNINVSSRITLQRNLSKKGSFRSGERKTNSNAANDKDTNFTATSPRGGTCTPEKAVALTSVGTGDQSTPQTHINHQIAGHTESKVGAKRFSFRRSSWTIIDPRRILFFFATLSSIGTILLIYFTLSMAKLNGEDSATING